MLERLISLPPVSFCLEVWNTYARAGISRSAAALAYYLVLTLFPLVMCVTYFIGLFHFNLEQVLRAADALLPAGVPCCGPACSPFWSPPPPGCAPYFWPWTSYMRSGGPWA